MKKSALIFLIISMLLILAGLHFTGLLSIPDSDIGIVGGADRPTANFYIREMMHSVYGLLILLGMPTAFCSLFALIFSRAVKKNCSLPTALAALGLSACASLGAVSLLTFASCFIMGNPSKNPIAFSASICVGMMALIGLILLIALYCKLRGKKASVPGVFLEAALAFIYTPTFFLAGVMISNSLSAIH